MSRHALLSPSAAHRWLNCPGSLSRCQNLPPEPSSPAAIEGTNAHALAAFQLSLRHGYAGTFEKPAADSVTPAMRDGVQAYVNFIEEIVRTHPDAQVSIEREVDFHSALGVSPGFAFGTCDCFIVASREAWIVDFKFGQGVPVRAFRNSQLMLYALGVRDKHPSIKIWHLCIVQPRVPDGTSQFDITNDELNALTASYPDIAKRALADGGAELCSGAWCRWCRSRGDCPAKLAADDAMLDEARRSLIAATTPESTSERTQLTAPVPGTDPALLTDEQVALVIRNATAWHEWLDAVTAHALDAAKSGHQFPGLTLKERKGRRSIARPLEAAQALQAAGVNPYQEPKLRTITDLEKELGKPRFETLCGNCVEWGAPSYTLVPDK